MSQPAELPRVAPVVDLDEWRFADLSPEERGILLARRASARPRLVPSWESLFGANMSDARDGAAILARLGGHPIAVYGAPGGVCMCASGAACESAGKHPVAKGWQSTPLNL